MSIEEQAARVRLVLMDVDGVLTDGKFYYLPGPNGTLFETKGFDSQDGIALQWLHMKGIQAGLISGRTSPAVEERARQAHFKYVYQGNTEKIPMLEEVLAKTGLSGDQVAFIGDDLTDVVVFRRVGLAIATANARPEVKRCAHFVTQSEGGQGAIRDAVELILKAQGHWIDILRKYEAEM